MSVATLTGLPRLSADEAHLRQVIPAALNGRRLGEGALRAAMLHAAPDGLDWYRCGEGLSFAVVQLAGTSVRPDPMDGPAAAALLERAEPLVAEVEAALSLALEPHDLGPLGDAPVLVAGIERVMGEVVLDCILLALPHDAAILPERPEHVALPDHIPLPVQLSIAGPRLSPTDAATLAPGDLLLLGKGPLDAVLRVAGGSAIVGRLDPAGRLFVPAPQN